MTAPSSLFVALLFGLFFPLESAIAATPTPSMVDAANDPATTEGAAAILRGQVLLDRARFGPGEIDAQKGPNLRRAISGYQAAHGLKVSGAMDAQTWAALNADTAPVLVPYTLTAEDVAGPYVEVPEEMDAKSKLPALGFATLGESLGERFHASPALLEKLNPAADFTQVGTVLQVPNVAAAAALPKAAKVQVDKSDSVLTLLDAQDKIIAQFPASSGSSHDPLPIGEWKIQSVAQEPSFHYNPDLFWDADPSHSKTKIAPGPNNPVGRVWIDLSKPHYGIHGTPEPVSVGKSQSHGCIRLTNWDALTVAAAVDASVPVVMQD